MLLQSILNTKMDMRKMNLQKTTLAVSFVFLASCSSFNQQNESSSTPKSTMDRVKNGQAAPKIAYAQRESLVAPMQLGTLQKKSRIAPAPAPGYHQNNEKYQELTENQVKKTDEDAVSTLSIDVDTGSYANMRRFLNQGKLPPKNAIRIEELLNYFKYDFKKPSDSKHPFSVTTELTNSPWNANNRILRVGVKAVDIKASEQPPANLVFLVDVSGSMSSPDKLDLAKASLKLLTKQLRKQDTVSMVVYAGRTQVELSATSGDKTEEILSAIDRLTAGGSTNGEAAMRLAYNEASKNFKKNGINRILMMTDGDFNVGLRHKEIIEMVEKNRKRGISLSTLGFGTGNYNEHMMEQVADKGNGNYSYIDNLSEAQKVFGEEMAETFNTVAKDVKLQLEFNPATVKEWRLIGYENRVLNKQDFNNDKVDAAEIGAGKSVVALYEITPTGKDGLISDSRYQKKQPKKGLSNELGFLKVRYKQPNVDKSTLFSLPISNNTKNASDDMKFAMAVAGFGQILKNSNYAGKFTYQDASKLAKQGLGNDTKGYRGGFVKLVELAEALDYKKP